jgi:4-hydroxybenzoate polyprenyltransferase
LQGTDVEADFSQPAANLADWVYNFRLHQWAKNLLIFAPILLSGQIWDLSHWAIATVGVIAMGLTASATYIINDIFDISDDRRHWKKRHRPIAAGLISIPQAGSADALIAAGVWCGAHSGRGIRLVAGIFHVDFWIVGLC